MSKQITVLGGGTGTSTVLNGLKDFPDLKLRAVVVVSDSGGSTGRLRDEFGFLPVGDLRQCLAALAKGKNQEPIRELLLYRFNQGNGLRGHNLGNLILTALSDIADSPSQAVEIASKIFAIQGKVYPVTEKVVDLVIEYEDGRVLIGEDNLDNPELGGKKISKVTLSPRAEIYHKAARAILDSDCVVIGPGDLYASLLPNTLPRGFKPALKKNTGKFVYVVNLMTHFSQTHGMKASDHVAEIKKYCGRQPDIVIINSGSIAPQVLEWYEQNQEYPVEDDLPDSASYTIVRENLIADVAIHQQESDLVQRSVLRHDGTKLAKIIHSLVI